MKKLMVFILILFYSCGSYNDIDKSYNNGEYLKSYQLLKDKSHLSNKTSYQKRLFSILIRLSSQNDIDFISVLQSLSINPISNKKLVPYVNYSEILLNYLNSKSTEDYIALSERMDKKIIIPKEFEIDYQSIYGISTYKAGLYERAKQILSNILNKLFISDVAYYLGMSYFYLDQYDEALKIFNKVLKNETNQILLNMVAFQMGEIYYNKSDYQNAVNFYKIAVNALPYSAICNYKIARSLQKSGYTQLYARFLKISLRLQKDFANAWYFLNVN